MYLCNDKTARAVAMGRPIVVRLICTLFYTQSIRYQAKHDIIFHSKLDEA